MGYVEKQNSNKRSLKEAVIPEEKSQILKQQEILLSLLSCWLLECLYTTFGSLLKRAYYIQELASV